MTGHIAQPLITPLLQVRLNPDSAAIWCKLEFMNPSGSTKDRIARHILGKAVRSGQLQPGDVVVEASSGSTSIAMAMVCAQLDLRFIAVMPEGVSPERRAIIEAYGGACILTERSGGILHAIAAAETIAQEQNAFLPRQFSNPDNAAAHRMQTAQEIMGQLAGISHGGGAGNHQANPGIDAVVSGVGTGGTLVGLWHGLCDHGCRPLPIAARPTTGAAFPDAECCSFSQRIPGVVDGLSTIYANAELEGLREIEVDDRLAVEVARGLIRAGFPVGPSSGLNYAAAQMIARELGPAAQIVTVFPDRMERYFSTELFQLPQPAQSG